MTAAASIRWPAYLILALFITMMAAIAVITYKQSNSLNGFLLGNRGTGAWMSAFIYGTTYFSSVVFVGYAGTIGSSVGLAAIWIGVANAFVGSLCAWLLLANRTRVMTRNIDAKTMPEFFEKRYDSSGIKLLAGVTIFIFLIPYSVSVYLGVGYIANMIFGISYELCIFIMALLVAVYLFVGGYVANAVGNFIQGIIMLVGITILIIVMLTTEKVGGFKGISNLSANGYGLFPSWTNNSGLFIDSKGFTLLTNILLTSFGIMAVPQSVTKFYSIKNKEAVNKGVVVSTLFALIIGGGAYLNGSFVRLFFPTGETSSTVISDMFVEAGFTSSAAGYALMGLIGILILSASMSTLSSLALAGSSALCVDVYKGYLKKDAADDKVKMILRAVCFVFVIVSAILAYLEVSAIVTLMSLSWGTLAGAFIGPYIYGLYSKKINKAGAYTSIIMSIVTTIVLIFVFGGAVYKAQGFAAIFAKGMSKAPLIGVIVMIQSLIVTPIASLIGAKRGITTKPETIAAAFDKIGKNK